MKIQSHLSIKTRKSVRKKLQDYKMLQRFLVVLQRKYCLLTGFLHVLPDFYILGVEKGGTSSLYMYLIQNPSFHSAVTKEINFFTRYSDRGLDWYRVCFPFKFHKFIVKNLKNENFLTGEASVGYFDYPHAPQKIKKITPNAKFIILLRNPAERAYSQHNMVVEGGFDNLSFEEAITNEKERTRGEYEKMLKNEDYYSKAYFLHAYLDRGIYIDKLKRWMSIFPKEQFLIMNSEEFFKNPSFIYHQTLEFLNVPKWDLEHYAIHGNVNKNRGIDSKLRNQLVEFYRPHNEKLYEFLGVNYHWEE